MLFVRIFCHQIHAKHTIKILMSIRNICWTVQMIILTWLFHFIKPVARDHNLFLKMLSIYADIYNQYSDLSPLSNKCIGTWRQVTQQGCHFCCLYIICAIPAVYFIVSVKWVYFTKCLLSMGIMFNLLSSIVRFDYWCFHEHVCLLLVVSVCITSI